MGLAEDDKARGKEGGVWREEGAVKDDGVAGAEGEEGD